MRCGVLVLVAMLTLAAPRAADPQVTSWESQMAVGAKAYQEGHYGDAEKSFVAAVKEAEGFGPDDPRLATSLNNLAEVYRAQGRYGEAEPLDKRALAIWEKALGPEHPDVATSLENYAALLRKTNREAEAATMEARVKAIRTRHREQNPVK